MNMLIQTGWKRKTENSEDLLTLKEFRNSMMTLKQIDRSFLNSKLKKEKENKNNKKKKVESRTKNLQVKKNPKTLKYTNKRKATIYLEHFVFCQNSSERKEMVLLSREQREMDELETKRKMYRKREREEVIIWENAESEKERPFS